MKSSLLALTSVLLLVVIITFATGFESPAVIPAAPVIVVPAPSPTVPAPPAPPVSTPPAETVAKPVVEDDGPSVKVVANPADVSLLVNKQIMLPDGYKPDDLVEPNVPFIFAEKADKRLLRKEAADALEQLFAAAKLEGLHLAGVSGYRSYETQKGLFDYYVRTEGEERARRYSAEPGHSEHQTGLAMDVSGSTGKCAADDCFADTPEAKWLAMHASEHGFIIRYLKGKETITGYAYEPWHLRYVGPTMSSAIGAQGLTLEEYYGASR